MLNLLHVRTFLAVCECGSYRAVARDLDLAPSTVLDHVRQLEAALGVPLLGRSGGRMKPTRRGDRFLPLARALLSTAGRAREIVREDGVKLAAASNIGVYMLQSPIASLKATAGIEVESWIGTNTEAIGRLERGEADMAALEWWDDRPGFEAHAWRKEDLVVIVPASHAFATRGSIRVEDLLGEPLLGGEPGTGTGRVLREALGPIADRLRIAGNLGSTEAVKRAVRAGRGISIVLRAAVLDEVENGHLAALSIAEAALFKQFWLVTREGLPVDAQERACIAAIRQGGAGGGLG